MRRKRRIGAAVYTPGFKLIDMEWSDDIKAIAREQAIADRKARKKFEEQGRIIAEGFERERQQQHAEALQKQAQYRIDLKLAALDEKMQSAVEAEREEARRVFGAYAERITIAFRNAVETAAKDREQVAKRLRKIEKDMERSRLHDERMELIRRGVLKGRR